MTNPNIASYRRLTIHHVLVLLIATIYVCISSFVLASPSSSSSPTTIAGQIISSRAVFTSGDMKLRIKHLPMRMKTNAVPNHDDDDDESVVVVVNDEDEVYVRPDGSFELIGMTHGSHLVEIECTSTANQCPLFGSSLRVDVNRDSGRLRAMWNDGSKQPVAIRNQQLLVIEPRKSTVEEGKFLMVDYFEKKEPFNPLSMLMNPMVIMMVVAVGIAFLMPKLVDQEAMREAQQALGEGENTMRGFFSNIQQEKKPQSQQQQRLSAAPRKIRK